MLAALLVAARDGGAQQSVPPPKAAEEDRSAVSPPVVAAPAPQKISKQELDAQLASAIESAFGKDSAAARRPVRIWLPQVGMGVAAKEAALGQGGRSVRFVDVSLGLPAEAKILHGTEGTIVIDRPIMEIGQLTNRAIVSVELQTKTGVVTLSPSALSGSFTGFATMPPSGAMPAPPQVSRFEKTEKKTIEMKTEKIADMKMAERPMATFRQFNGQFNIRFNFKLDTRAPLVEFLPIAAKLSKAAPPFNEDLAKVAEIGFSEPMAKDMDKHQAMEAIAYSIAKINHLNAKKHDGFMLAMIENRADLHGLPFLMGDDCRSGEKLAASFAVIAQGVRQLTQNQNGQRLPDGSVPNEFSDLNPTKLTLPGTSPETVQLALVAALMQIMMPESEQARVNLAKYLATVPHIDATKALARLALFSAEDVVRAAAIEGLRLRSERDYTDVLMQGFNYPLPAVAKRSAEALVKLDRKDVLADLVNVLERPDPRLPFTEKRDGKDAMTVRELVKVNHHRNCLLCHAPGNTENTPAVALKVAVPSPVEPLPKPTDGGGYQTTPSTPDILVRIDMTYLRQDFSLMMPVADAHPWPEMQRFDFLVRTRPVTPTEVQAFESRRETDEPGQPSVYHRAALFALRELSGRDAEATPQAWRKVLNIAKRS